MNRIVNIYNINWMHKMKEIGNQKKKFKIKVMIWKSKYWRL